MKNSMGFADIIDGFGILGRFYTAFIFVLFIIGLAGIPEDVSTWGIWLKKVLPFSDYLFGIITGVTVTVITYETSPLWISLFKQTSPRPDISLIEVVGRAWSKYWSSTFDFEEFGNVLWNALAGGHITA